MDRVLSPGERGNEKGRPQYRQPAKEVDGDGENPNNRSSRKLNEDGCRNVVSLLQFDGDGEPILVTTAASRRREHQLLPRENRGPHRRLHQSNQ